MSKKEYKINVYIIWKKRKNLARFTFSLRTRTNLPFLLILKVLSFSFTARNLQKLKTNVSSFSCVVHYVGGKYDKILMNTVLRCH